MGVGAEISRGRLVCTRACSHATNQMSMNRLSLTISSTPRIFYRMDKNAREVLAKRVRERRAALGWSQDDLADIAGLHRTYIGSIERAEQSIGVDNIEKIAKALNVPISELFQD